MVSFLFFVRVCLFVLVCVCFLFPRMVGGVMLGNFEWVMVLMVNVC